MNVFHLENQIQPKLAVQLEPWAEVYYLRRGETLKLEQPPELKGGYHVIFYEADSVSILIDGEFDYPLVFIDGKEATPFNDFVVYPQAS
ncbi:hypothetical protein E4631_24580 [Hymenobacter sp. UV11]|uniref:hypothetical protein n=1 Tax=Hymenobacter sp. UV11 TaxID=1849735 RepID=UPI00105D341C|nr:hypothetical protein [Hymenobacter sp. UV11]TDN36829.1 hypothetical protein A8B98_07005 [Hymenobacter sp. UV11]TFZ62733.1 hypothetical protein E4631_24580 [Hymenobacter sp. UV11]